MPRLTDTQIKAAKPARRSFKLYDEDGLFVLVYPNRSNPKRASKYFRMRYTLHGREKVLAFGVYPETTLAKAREKTQAARVAIREGKDPAVERRKAKLSGHAAAEATFRVIAEEWVEAKASSASPSYASHVRSALRTRLLPKLGSIPVSEINAPVLLGALKAIEAQGKLELTRRCRMWARQILDYATATGRRVGENPARALTKDVLAPPQRNHRPALDEAHAGLFLRRLVEYPGKPETQLAITLLLLTAARPGEVQAARWSEFDLKRAEWRLPAGRMKARREHHVPLSRQAVEALEDLRKFTGAEEYLFPSGSRRTPYISENTINFACQRLLPEAPITAHGMRSFFSTWANEAGEFRHDVIEAALAHAGGDAVRSAYNRTTYTEERRALMQAWADRLDAWRRGGKIVKFKTPRRKAA
jgi:integrase